MSVRWDHASGQFSWSQVTRAGVEAGAGERAKAGTGTVARVGAGTRTEVNVGAGVGASSEIIEGVGAGAETRAGAGSGCPRSVKDLLQDPLPGRRIGESSSHSGQEISQASPEGASYDPDPDPDFDPDPGSKEVKMTALPSGGSCVEVWGAGGEDYLQVGRSRRKKTGRGSEVEVERAECRKAIVRYSTGSCIL